MRSARSLRSNDRGTIAVVFALAAIPLMISVGFAVDYARAISAKENVQSTLDSAILSVAHEAATMSTEQVRLLVENQVKANLGTAAAGFTLESVTAKLEDGALVADVQGHFSTMLLPIVNMAEVPIAAHAEAVAANVPMEIALALDVTGSMGGDMPKLRDGAQTFIDVVTAKGTNGKIKVGLVPFVGAVNIGKGTLQEGWLDKAGDSAHAGQTVREKWLAADNNSDCSDYELSDPNNGGGGNQQDGLLQDKGMAEVIQLALAELFGIRPASAAPYQSHVVFGCYHANPDKISNWELFKNLSNVTWKGCVEARPAPYDIDDTAPGASANTRWVPYFWLDGLDKDAKDGDNTNYPDATNDYILDGPLIANTDMATSDWGRSFSVMKYHGQAVQNLDETPPGTSGPNKACPPPIVPLTTNYNVLKTNVAALVQFNDGGTNTVEGLAWGWRVLSPGLPFDEGRPYGENRKIIVLFSDGGNQVLADSNTTFLSHYNSYGFVRYGRYASEDNGVATQFLNQRMLDACTKIKDIGIEIYVVAFGVSGNGLNRLKTCATDTEHVISVPRGSDLTAAFTTFARQISPLRLTR